MSQIPGSGFPAVVYPPGNRGSGKGLCEEGQHYHSSRWERAAKIRDIPEINSGGNASFTVKRVARWCYVILSPRQVTQPSGAPNPRPFPMLCPPGWQEQGLMQAGVGGGSG